MSRSQRALVAIALAVLGSAGILYAHSIMFPRTPPEEGGYYFTKLLVQNYTWYTAGGYFLWAGMVAILTRSAWFLIGPAMSLVFLTAIIYEMFLDSTSHNLLPIEIAVYAVFAIPSTLGAYIVQFSLQAIKRRGASATQL